MSASILIVDDDAAIRTVVAEALRRDGYRVRAVATLAECDVLVIKIPTARYSAREIDAVVEFVAGGGGLLLIGDHTNYERSAAYLNDIARRMGFVFRDDLLYSTAAAPDQQRYERPLVPHPAVAAVPKQTQTDRPAQAAKAAPATATAAASARRPGCARSATSASARRPSHPASAAAT